MLKIIMSYFQCKICKLNNNKKYIVKKKLKAR